MDCHSRRLSDGSIGYHPLRFDACFPAALATCLRVPIEEVPDPCLDERLEAGEDAGKIDRAAKLELSDWLRARDLAMETWETTLVNGKHYHERKLPERWIGIAPWLGGGGFSDHCLVMAGTDRLFDPSTPPAAFTDLSTGALVVAQGAFGAAEGQWRAAASAASIRWGFAFNRVN